MKRGWPAHGFAGLAGLAVAVSFAVAAGPEPAHASGVCSTATPSPLAMSPEYYQIDLVSTKRVPGTAWSRGTGDVTFAASPFSVSLGVDGSYRYDVALSFQRLPDPVEGVYAAWFTTTQLDEVIPLGAITSDREMTGTVDWNQFIIVVSLESSEAEIGDRWAGPIVMRGISRSAMMHTMAGHGPFQQENCATYGY